MKSKVPETNRLDRKTRQSSKELEKRPHLRNKTVVGGFNTGMLTDTTLALANHWHSRCHTQHSGTGRFGIHWRCLFYTDYGPRNGPRVHTVTTGWGHTALCCEDTMSFTQVADVSCSAATFHHCWVQEWLLQTHWTMPRVCCWNSFLTPEGTEAFLSLAQQLPLRSQCLPTYQPSRFAIIPYALTMAFQW